MATLIGMRSSKLNEELPPFSSVGSNFGDREDLPSPLINGHNQSIDYAQQGGNHRPCQELLASDGNNPTRILARAHLVGNGLHHKYSQSNHQVAEAGKGITHNSPAESSIGTPLLTESSTMSLQEMFDHDDLIPPSTADYPQGDQQSTREEGHRGEDQWFNGDGGILEKDDYQSFTAPLTLYGGTREAYGTNLPGPIPESSNPSSVCSSGMNTPVSCVSQNTSILSLGEAPQSSVGSNTTASFSRNRPILYSAIGSLETFNAASFGDISKRVGPRRDFSKLGSALPALIPPLSTAQPSPINDVSRTTLAVDSQELQSQPSSTVFTRATPTASNRKPNVEKETQFQPNDQQHIVTAKEHKPSNLKQPSLLTSKSKSSAKSGKGKKVSIKKDPTQKKPVEMFRPSCDAYTPRIEKKRIEYRKAEMRTPVQKMASPMGTLSRPNFRDALRRVAMIIHQHIVKIERRFEGVDNGRNDQGLFTKSMRETFSEENYCTPTYKCTMVRIPMARPGMVYGLRKIKAKHTIPTEEEIYEFAHQLFKSVQLSSECSIVCLIYVERLMEVAKVPLLADTWRPIFMCGLLLASKVWQDLSSWNIEFASVYPQYCLEAINRLELNFLRNVKWDLYISTSLYAKYYFALRSLVEKVDFRQRYNRMVGGVDNVAQSEALKISKRTEQFKEETILQLSRSM